MAQLNAKLNAKLNTLIPLNITMLRKPLSRNFITIALSIALTIVLLSPASTIANPRTPILTLATDQPLSDRPTHNDPSRPANLRTDGDTVRGIVCQPNQAAEDCDQRVPVRSRNYPWSAIGRLEIGSSSHCTATLIDENWILTNAHCVIDEKTHKITTETLTFGPNLINGSLKKDSDRATVIKVISGTDFTDSDVVPHPQDWAILKIDRPLGKTYGTIGWKSIPSSFLIKQKNQFSLTGYSFDFPNTKQYPELTAGPGFTAGTHQKCSFTGEESNRVLIHNCDTRPGASGSAIIGWIKDKPYVVAIHNAGKTDQRTGLGTENYAINVTRLNDWFIKQERMKKN